MDNKIISLKKRISATILAIVLIAGTITTLLSLSFMIGVNAQAQPYYDDDRIKNDYNSYGYSEYRDQKEKYDDSYGPTDYYGIDKNRKSYGTYSNESKYASSYEPNYKPKHSSDYKHDQPPSSPSPSQDTTLYVANFGDDTVERYDISTPLNPVNQGEFGAGDLDNPNGLATQGTTLYVANYVDDTVEIYDISNPVDPVRVDEFGGLGDLDNPNGLATQGTTLYVGNVGDNTVEIYDISTPLTPVNQGEFGAGELDDPAGITS